MLRRNDLLTRVSRDAGIHKYQCEKVLDAVLYEIVEALKREEKIILPGFAVIEVGEKRERLARDPVSGVVKTYPAVKVIKCKISQSIKQAVNQREEV